MTSCQPKEKSIRQNDKGSPAERSHRDQGAALKVENPRAPDSGLDEDIDRRIARRHLNPHMRMSGLYVTSMDGVLYRSRDEGKTWQEEFVAGNELGRVWGINGELFVVGSGGTILHKQ